MGYEWTIDPGRRFVTIVASGRVDFESSMETMRSIAADKRYHPEFDTLVDLRQMEYKASLGDIHQFSEMVAKLGIYKGRMAIVVTSADHFGAARQFSAFSEGHGREFEVFTGMRNALRWLGLPEDSLP